MKRMRPTLLTCACVLLGTLSPGVHAQAGDNLLKFYASPNAMQIEAASVASNGRLINTIDGRRFVLHPAASIQWSSGEKAQATDIAVSVPLRVEVFDSRIDVPVIKLVVIPTQ